MARFFWKKPLLVFLAGQSVSTLLSLAKSRPFLTNPTNPANLISAARRNGLSRFSAFLAISISLLAMARGPRAGQGSAARCAAMGLAGAAPLLILPLRLKVNISLYLFARALYVAVSALQKRRIFPIVPHGDIFLMALSNFPIAFSYIVNPRAIDRGYYGFLIVHGGQDERAMIALGDLVRGQWGWGPVQGRRAAEVRALAAAEGGGGGGDASWGLVRHKMDAEAVCGEFRGEERWRAMAPTERRCALGHPTTTSCVVGILRFFAAAYGRALRVYLPLNALGLAVRWKELIRRPLHVLFRSLLSVARSSTFLASYCSAAWATTCAARALCGRDPLPAYLLNGLLAGSCVAIESKPRRIEMALYCLPRAMEIVARGLGVNIPGIEYALHAIAVAVLSAAHFHEPEHLTPLLRTVLNFALGKKRSDDE
jgi:hypothetical protein